MNGEDMLKEIIEASPLFKVGYKAGYEAGERAYSKMVTGMIERGEMFTNPRSKGYWCIINCDGVEHYGCNQCGFMPNYSGSIHSLNYCPNCGAEMEGQNEK